LSCANKLLFGVHPLTAVGTDLLYAAVTKTAGTAIHSKKGNVDWRVAGLLPPIGPRHGAHHFGPVPGAEAEPDHFLLPVLASILVLIGLRLITS
jgi:uncharacterized membrane protein YfcA